MMTRTRVMAVAIERRGNAYFGIKIKYTWYTKHMSIRFQA